MGLKSLQEDDLIDIVLDEDDAADAGTFIPAGQAADGEEGLPCLVIMNEPRQTVVVSDDGMTDTRRATALGSRTQLRALIERLVGIARDPDRQDGIAFAVGTPYEGLWLIERADVDASGCSMDLRWERSYAVSGQGVRTP